MRRKLDHLHLRQFTGAVLAATGILFASSTLASESVSQEVVVSGPRSEIVRIAHSASSSDTELVGWALPTALGSTEKPGSQECLPHSWSQKFLPLSGGDTPVRALVSRCWGYSTRPLPTGPIGNAPAFVLTHPSGEGWLIQQPAKSRLISIAPVQDLLASSGTRTTCGPMLAASRIDEFAEEDKDKVSVTRATLLSLVLPGAGQWYAGERRRAAGFLAADGLIWAAFGYFETVGAAKRNDYKVYARVHAGIDPSGKDEAFYKTITFYDSRAEYNNIARVFDPRRPYYGDTTVWDWQWDSDASRGHYRTILNQSNEAFNRGKFSIAALALNRLVAALDAMRVARSVNRRARMESGWRIKLDGNPVAADPAFAVTLSRHF